jgi:hypothetical protein
LAVMAKLDLAIHTEMLKAALHAKLGGNALQNSLALVDQVRMT